MRADQIQARAVAKIVSGSTLPAEGLGEGCQVEGGRGGIEARRVQGAVDAFEQLLDEFEGTGVSIEQELCRNMPHLVRRDGKTQMFQRKPFVEPLADSLAA
jgi:hypothetical protein